MQPIGRKKGVMGEWECTARAKCDIYNCLVHLLQALSSAISCTVMQLLTAFQPTDSVASRGPSAIAESPIQAYCHERL